MSCLLSSSHVHTLQMHEMYVYTAVAGSAAALSGTALHGPEQTDSCPASSNSSSSMGGMLLACIMLLGRPCTYLRSYGW
jgi:hypothetical protein